jgi:hypothetical protein
MSAVITRSCGDRLHLSDVLRYLLADIRVSLPVWLSGFLQRAVAFSEIRARSTLDSQNATDVGHGNDARGAGTRFIR